MWRPWSGLLEALGRIRLGFSRSRPVQVGSPSAFDAEGGTGWRAYLTAEELFKVWGPVPGSAWEPFHCVPLFAALDRIPRGRVGPTDPERAEAATLERQGRAWKPGDPVAAFGLPRYARPGAVAPAWAGRSTWIIVDLPGRSAVEAAAWLVTAAGCQPVCTFDNWPHPKGLIRAEDILAELIRWATTLARVRGGLGPDAPPVWVCDSERLGERRGRPGEFDNRYFLDDSILPGPGLLRRAGIRAAVYLSADDDAAPVVDLEHYFAELLTAGLPVYHVHVLDATLDARPFAGPSVPRRPPRSGFRRSAAGGFGTEVPEPSSGGSSG